MNEHLIASSALVFAIYYKLSVQPVDKPSIGVLRVHDMLCSVPRAAARELIPGMVLQTVRV